MHIKMAELCKLYTSIEKHILQDSIPSNYLNKIYNCSIFREYPFDMLYKLKITEQSKKYHPEGNVWNHTLLVVDEAGKIKSKSKDKKVFMWSAFLHDIGKPSTTKKTNGRITSYNHDKIGAELAKEFLLFFKEDKYFICNVYNLIRYHMQILFVANNLPFADIEGMKYNTDIREIALLGLCDRMGRLNSNRLEERKNIQKFLQKCKKYTSNLK
ncbi:HDIG domain-containing protein [Clostridium tyrobutyricum]|jgi:putative nucleotidyltransferase with HDIG domain|uniref:HD superfamily hydrolase n=2 Tax=Clostridium tyrobutyricum TaxID=1519 RepID=W6N6R3_CLOTY|nr:HDIG domain-containing metalloprotein [Clostridium tyrobutyricum]AND85484.1 HD superfamily hydrolase [Clostridium tyrobutyricum]ANP70029.1 phosphohydrolase [Clostridium tyrobutyricum]MBR9649268.1 HDIG domain-containing protein [Clostridium tyrobutyricum]MBV4416152.1 HD domain-containing protein [Clostridium tyrobutyricum]MBV4424263.1 HD domain-containing protein [Clostridium tyrobutyricum]